MSVESASSIQKADSDDSIVAYQQDASDFFDSIGPTLPSPPPGQYGSYLGISCRSPCPWRACLYRPQYPLRCHHVVDGVPFGACVANIIPRPYLRACAARDFAREPLSIAVLADAIRKIGEQCNQVG